MVHHTNPIAVKEEEKQSKFNELSQKIKTIDGIYVRCQSYSEFFQSANRKTVPHQRDGTIEQVSDANTFHGNM